MEEAVDVHRIDAGDEVVHPIIRGERELLVAILERTFADLYMKSERAAAVEWLTDEATVNDKWSYPWICQEIGFDVELYKVKAEKLIESSYDKVGTSKFAAYANAVSCQQPQSVYNASRRVSWRRKYSKTSANAA